MKREDQEEIRKEEEFREKLRVYIEQDGRSQATIARKLGYTAGALNKWLNGVNKMPSDALLNFCKLVGLDPAQTKELFDLAGYVISLTIHPDSPRTPSLVGKLPDDIAPHPEEVTARSKYLEAMRRRYSAVTLPIGPAQGFSLQAVFQPLRLRRDPLAAEDLDREELRALLGEQRYSDTDPRRVFLLLNDRRFRDQMRQNAPVVIAENGDDALRKNPKRSMVILGGPGTGKTTLLEYLVGDRAGKALTDPTESLPIFISLPDLASSGKTLKEYLTSTVQNVLVEERFAQILWKALDQGNAFVCLDGLDEVSPRQRPGIIRLINEWAASTDSIYIVGTRFTDYKGGQLKSESFTEWELLPLNPSLCKELAKRLLPELYRLMRPMQVLSEDDIAVYVALLDQQEVAKVWSENPLLFSLATVVFVSTGILPSNRASLYRQVINAILLLREPDQWKQPGLRDVAAALALELYREKGRIFTRHDMLRLLRVVRKKADELWDAEEIALRIIDSGIVEVVARDAYGFRHPTFQEYLVAVALAQHLVSRDQAIRESEWNFAWGKRTYSRWTEVLRLMVGVLIQDCGQQGVREAVLWLRALLKQRNRPEGDPGNLCVSLALRSLNELTEMKVGELQGEGKAIVEEVVTNWINILLDSTRYQTPPRGLLPNGAHLNEHIVSLAVERLMPLLASNSGDRHQRLIAVETLGKLGERVPLERQMELLDDPDGDVRHAAVQALGKRVPLERQMELLDDPDGDVRRAVVQALGERASVEQLMPLLESPDRQVRSAVVQTLGERMPIKRLERLLWDGDEFVRWMAVLVLGEMGERAPVAPLLTCLEFYAKHRYARSDRYMLPLTIEALGKLGERAPVERLVALLSDTDEEIRYASVRALGALGERAPLKRLMALLNDPDEDMRRIVKLTLWKMGERVPEEHLVEILNDTDDQTRRVAAWALRELGEWAPIDALLTLLEDPDEWIRCAAVHALGKQEARAPTEPLVALMKNDPDANVRREAVEALGERAPVDTLMAMLEDLNERVRRAAVYALGKQGERAPIDFLVTLLEDPSLYISQEAKAALGKQGKQRPGSRSWPSLEDPVRDMRQAAAAALKQLGERVPMELLMPLLESPNKDVRYQAIRLLGRRAPVDRMIILLDDPDGSVQCAAIEALEGRVPATRLMRLLDHPAGIVRSTVVEVLKERVPVEYLIRLLKDVVGLVRRKAVYALGRVGEQVPVEHLMPLLQDSDGAVRSAVVDVIEGLDVQIPIERLLVLAESPDKEIRKTAVEALGAQGERAPVKRLMELLGDPDWGVRYAAANALRELREQVPVELLLPLLENPQREARLAAVRALGERAPIEPLVAMLEDPDEDTRYVVAEVMGEFGERAPIELLAAMLEDTEGEVRIVAAESLGKLGKRVPVEQLLAAVGDRDDRVQRAAVAALRRTHPDSLSTIVTEAVTILQRKGSGSVLGATGQALIAQTIGNIEKVPAPLLEHLTGLLDWPHWYVQMHAIRAFGRLSRNIPDIALQRLHNFRLYSPSRSVRKAADDTLAKILSLETGIEDD